MSEENTEHEIEVVVAQTAEDPQQETEEPKVEETTTAETVNQPPENESQEESRPQTPPPESKSKIYTRKAWDITKKLAKRWFIDAFTGMAQGLFCTLIAGTIFEQIAKWIGKNNYLGGILFGIAQVAKMLMGSGIGVGIAHALNLPKLVMFSAGVAGFVGAFSDKILNSRQTFAVVTGAPGNPIGAYVEALAAAEITALYAGKTKLDILIIPLGALVISFIGIYVAWPFIWLVKQLGELVNIATDATPFVMGIVLSVLMGICLTLPTSSAAIWVSVAAGVTDESMLIAGGACVVGCSCQMIGFAVASFRENGIAGLISQGIGTSMLQIPNIMKNPRIMLPEIIASAILGPIATCAFKLKCNAAGGGMGTSGLVGVFGVIDATDMAGSSTTLMVFGIIFLMFILPAVICFLLSEVFRRLKWIKFGDQQL